MSTCPAGSRTEHPRKWRKTFEHLACFSCGVEGFHTMGVRDNELARQVFKRDHLLRRRRLAWCVGAGICVHGKGRQGLFDSMEARIQVYVDDPCTLWQGTSGWCGCV